MDSETVVNALVGIGGVVSGLLVAWIAFRKMPSENRSSESSTIKNLIESNRMLTEDNRGLHQEIDDVMQLVTGSYEVTTRFEMNHPPKILGAEIRKLPVVQE